MMRAISRIVSTLALAASGLLYVAWTQAAETDPTKIVPEAPLSLPAVGITYNDPAFGTPTVRVAVNARPEYSQLQAWNADVSLLLVNSGTILDATSYAVLHRVDFGWPAWGNGLRWSPVERYTLYYTGGGVVGCSGAALMKYTLIPGTPMTAARTVVGCFPEYAQFDKNASFEEMSDDGRYIGLVGVKSSGGYEGFIFDLVTNTKRTALALPKLPEWVAASPSGRYAVVNWGGGGDSRYNGVEAFDLDMRYLGTISTGHGHGDLAIDPNGAEWYVDFSPDNYVGVTGPLVKKNRIPDGYTTYKTNNSAGTIVSLLRTDWYHGAHISCRSPRSGWCVMSTYFTQSGYDNGWQPFENEIFKVFLDGTESAPHVERLSHHRSRPYSLQLDGCNNSNYWAQPHATSSPRGDRIIFGSNWGRICDLSNPVDAFILMPDSNDIDIAPPIPPAGLTVN